MYEFDKLLKMDGTDSAKWESYRKRFETVDDLIPMWVADMDFPSPREVTEALVSRAKHPIYGYPALKEEFYESVCGWIKRRFHTSVEKNMIHTTPGVVTGLHIAIDAFTNPGDKVIIQPPVYHPFFHAITNRNRETVLNPLKEVEGQYCIDFDDLEKKIDDQTKMLILCNPHNPVGKVWEREDLIKLADICKRNNVMIVSDEVHSDLVYKPNKHVPFYSFPKEYTEHSLTFLAPSKTFNLAGLFTSIVITGSEQISEAYLQARDQLGLKHVNLFGVTALKAAYTHGEQWLEEVLMYLSDNATFIHNYLKEHIPGVKMAIPEATYLGWIDFRNLNIEQEKLDHMIMHKAKVALNSGQMFGDEGVGFQRINFACPRPLLEEAMERLKLAVVEVKE